MALTKADIAAALVNEADMQHQDAKDMVDSFFEQLRLNLENGNQLKISGFGNFELKDKSARPGRNPKTGVEVEISPRRVVTFKAGQKLRARLIALAEKFPDGDIEDEDTGSAGFGSGGSVPNF